MQRGDVILTPSWHWHDHGNEGTDPVIWLDGLDLPIFKILKLNFAQPYAEPRYPSTISTDCTAQSPWAPVEEVLRQAKGAYACYHYTGSDGGHLSKTLSAQAERMSRGSSSPFSQETISFVYHVVSGDGFSTILAPRTQEETGAYWKTKDTFAVPAWSQVSHTCEGANDVFLFAINDRPLVQTLGLYRKRSDMQ